MKPIGQRESNDEFLRDLGSRNKRENGHGLRSDTGQVFRKVGMRDWPSWAAGLDYRRSFSPRGICCFPQTFLA